MDSADKYVVEMPAGCPAKIFVPVYASELRKKLAGCLGFTADQVRINDETKEKYSLRVLQGAISGMQVTVEKRLALLSDGLQVTVSVGPYSKIEHAMMRTAQVIWVLLAVPTFFMVIPFVRFIILSFFVAVLLLAPLMLAIKALIRVAMSIAYSSFGNEFDATRRAALLATLRQVPLPDLLAAFRPRTQSPG